MILEQGMDSLVRSKAVIEILGGEVPLYSWMTCRRRVGLGGGRAPAILMGFDGD